MHFNTEQNVVTLVRTTNKYNINLHYSWVITEKIANFPDCNRIL